MDLQKRMLRSFVSTMNSYYGLMKHFATYNIRRKIAAMLLPEWWNMFISKDILKSLY